MSTTSLPSRVGIVGLGLVGGSLARALKERTSAPWIVASSLDPSDLQRARSESVVDAAEDDAARVASAADLVVYATPLEATLALLGEHRDRWRQGAVVTDVAGLKAPVLERARDLGVARRYVGAHPLAGTEGRGFGASRADLFRDAPVHLVRGEAEARAAGTVEAVWTAVGGRPTWTEAGAHDRRMAWASHLPQLVSNAVAAALSAEGVGSGELGTGGRDVTRLAASPSAVWRDLLRHMADADARALRAVVRELEAVAGLLEAGREDELAGYMERTRRWARGGEGEDR